MIIFPECSWRSWRKYPLALILIASGFPQSSSAVDSNQYLLHFRPATPQSELYYPLSVPTAHAPRIQLDGAIRAGLPLAPLPGDTLDAYYRLEQVNPPGVATAEGRMLALRGWLGSVCSKDATMFDRSLPVGTEFVAIARFDQCGAGPQAWEFVDRYQLASPVRRKASDGGEFEALPLRVGRNGAAWETLFWGYRLGLVETVAEWRPDAQPEVTALERWPASAYPAALRDLKLTTLPPPWVEGEVTEYVNTADFPRQPDGQYFYAATDADRAALDGIATWRRTGNSFKQGGYVSVCRFYGGANGGPNTHFYSASDTECNWLKGVSFLSYEGQTFRVNKPLPLPANAPAGTQPSCPAGSKPLYRLYNNASAPGKNYVSNHRYVTSRTTVDAAVAIGWLDEGVSMCVPE